MDPGGIASRLVEGAGRVDAICRRFGIDSLRPHLAALEELLGEGGVVDVAVLGRFKAGKSSFLNALFGGPVVPVDVLPSTAVITRIGHGPRERCLVHGLDGGTFEVPVGRLAEFVTERGNPANGKRVAAVDVELPGLASYDGVRFVDTPGLGSVFARNTKASRDWMPRVGAALVAVSVNHPLSEDDLLLLSEVSSHTPEAAILLTKADLVSPQELASVIEFTRDQAASRTGKEWRVLAVSSRPGFEGLRAEAERYVREEIAGRKGEAHGAIARHKLVELSKRCRDYLLLSLRSSEAAERARKELLAALAAERRSLESVVSEIRSRCRAFKAEARTAADVGFHAFCPAVSERLSGDLRTAMPGWKGNLARESRAFAAWLSERMSEEMGSISLQGEGHLAGFLFKAQASVSRSVRAFQDRLAKEIERALGVRFGGARFDVRVEEPSHPDIRLSPTFDTHFELLWFLIPMAVFRPLVHRHFLRRIPWETEKNLSRVAAQWADAVGKAIDGIAGDGVRFLEQELATVEGMVGASGEPAFRAGGIRDALAELSAVESAVS
ncbi:MAG: dynamin family protein [Verrucomicrobiota bacterium]